MSRETNKNNSSKCVSCDDCVNLCRLFSIEMDDQYYLNNTCEFYVGTNCDSYFTISDYIATRGINGYTEYLQERQKAEDEFRKIASIGDEFQIIYTLVSSEYPGLFYISLSDGITILENVGFYRPYIQKNKYCVKCSEDVRFKKNQKITMVEHQYGYYEDMNETTCSYWAYGYMQFYNCDDKCKTKKVDELIYKYDSLLYLTTIPTTIIGSVSDLEMINIPSDYTDYQLNKILIDGSTQASVSYNGGETFIGTFEFTIYNMFETVTYTDINNVLPPLIMSFARVKMSGRVYSPGNNMCISLKFFPTYPCIDPNIILRKKRNMKKQNRKLSRTTDCNNTAQIIIDSIFGEGFYLKYISDFPNTNFNLILPPSQPSS
jgi:hypothetical protein